MKFTVLVTGGRDFKDRKLLDRVLDSHLEEYLTRTPGAHRFDFLLVHGEAIGADTLAAEWAGRAGVPCAGFQAPWDVYTKGRAGPIRNGWMLRHTNPDLVIAFPGGSGTANMVSQARGMCPVMVVGEDGKVKVQDD